MGIVVTFASSLDALGAWRATRVPLPRYLGLAAFLAWAALCADVTHFAQAATVFVFAFTLVLQFRLWDDLADRTLDRSAHPERILAAAEGVKPFVAAVWLLGGGNALGLASSFETSIGLGFVILNIATAAWYGSHRERGLTHVLVLHLKYPAFVLLLAPAHTAALAIAAASVYAALVAFELLDADRLRARVNLGLRYLPFAAASMVLVLVTIEGVP